MISTIMIRTAVLILVIGMIGGMAMGAAQDFALAPAHAHLNLVGGVLMLMFGLYYRLVPQSAEGVLPLLQAILHIVGAVVFPFGIAVALTKGPAWEILPIIGGTIVLVATILFAIVAFRAPAAEASPRPHRKAAQAAASHF